MFQRNIIGFRRQKCLVPVGAVLAKNLTEDDVLTIKNERICWAALAMVLEQTVNNNNNHKPNYKRRKTKNGKIILKSEHSCYL